MLKIGKRIKALREERELKQVDLAQVMQVNRMTINNYETGKRSPDIEFAVRCAEFFGVSVEYLTGLSEFRDKQDYQLAIEKLQDLADVVEMLPTEEGRQMTNAFTTLLQIAQNGDISEPVMFCLTNLYIQLAQLTMSYMDLRNNMHHSVSALKEANVDDELINAVLKEKPMSLFEHGMIVGANATALIQSLTNELIKDYTPKIPLQ